MDTQGDHMNGHLDRGPRGSNRQSGFGRRTGSSITPALQLHELKTGLDQMAWHKGPGMANSMECLENGKFYFNRQTLQESFEPNHLTKGQYESEIDQAKVAPFFECLRANNVLENRSQ